MVLVELSKEAKYGQAAWLQRLGGNALTSPIRSRIVKAATTGSTVVDRLGNGD